MAKPTTTINWGNVGVEPGAAKKLAGYATDEKWPQQYANWLHYITDQWQQYLDGEIDKFLTTYDAIVGTGGTHADINAVVADVAILEGSKILVVTTQTLNSTQIISKNGLLFDFIPRAEVLKGTANTGIQITGERVRLTNARFRNFSVGGDKALDLTAASKNCYIHGNMFNNNNAPEITDAGTNNTLANNIVEV